jgi:hypothetical protein
MLSKCDYKECEKFNTCARPHEQGELINFKAICPNNDYKWYINNGEIVVKEEEDKNEK